MTSGGPLRGFPGRSLALVVAVAYFMEELDGTVIATAAPRMAAGFHTPAVAVNVVMTAYLVTLAAAIPASAWLATRFGARRVFCGALVVFTVASALCAGATSLPELTATRVLQGLGGAMMVPVGRLVVLRRTPRTDLFAAIAFLTWPGLLAPVIAPVIGGAFAAYASWRWIFLVNVPIGLALLVLAARLMPAGDRDAADRERDPLDWAGLALTGAGLAAGLLGAEHLGGGPVTTALAWLAPAAVLLTLAVRHLRRAARPLLRLDVLRVRGFRTVVTGGSVYRTAIGAAPFLLPLMFQESFGWGPLRSGATVIAVFAGNVGIKPFTTRLMRRFGFRPVLLASTAGMTAAFLGFATLTAGWWPPALLGLLVASGVFRSTGYTAYNTLQFVDVGQERMPAASALASTCQQLGNALGVAVGALLLRVAGGVLGGAADSAGPYRVAFVALGCLAAVSAVPALRLAPDEGAAARPATA